MARKASFKEGWSGSGHHTQEVGTGQGMGGPASAPSEMGPRIGAGVLGKRVRPEYDKDMGNGEGRPKVRGTRTYSEE